LLAGAYKLPATAATAAALSTTTAATAAATTTTTTATTEAAPAALTATAATTTKTTTTTTGRTETTAAAAARTTLFARTGLFYFHRTTAEIVVIQGHYRRVAFRIIRHFHKANAPHLPGITIPQQVNAIHGAILAKHLQQLVIANVVGQVAYKNILHRSGLLT